jgi:hypothetical protein
MCHRRDLIFTRRIIGRALNPRFFLSNLIKGLFFLKRSDLAHRNHVDDYTYYSRAAPPEGRRDSLLNPRRLVNAPRIYFISLAPALYTKIEVIS